MPIPDPPSYRPKRQVLSIVALSLLFAVSLVLIYVARFFIGIALVGVGLGVLFVPVVEFFNRKARIPRGPGAVIVLLTIIGVATLLGVAVVDLVSGQVQLLIEQAPQIYDGLQERGSRIFERYPWLEVQFGNLNFAKAAQAAVQAVLGGLRAGVSAAAWAVITLLIALYVSANSDRYFRGVISLFPAYQRPEASRVMLRCAVVLRRWFKGQVLVMFTTGLVTTIGLKVIGVEFWLLFGALTVALGFIPFVGSILSTLVATLVTLGSDPEKALWVLGFFVIIQQIEGNVTIPLVMRGIVELPEVPLLILVIVLTSWLGLIGAIIAAPVMAVVRTVLLMTYVDRMDHRDAPPQFAESEKLKKTG